MFRGFTKHYKQNDILFFKSQIIFHRFVILLFCLESKKVKKNLHHGSCHHEPLYHVGKSFQLDILFLKAKFSSITQYFTFLSKNFITYFLPQPKFIAGDEMPTMSYEKRNAYIKKNPPKNYRWMQIFFKIFINLFLQILLSY